MNQDYFYVSTGPVGSLPNIFIVADGMGGHKAGDVASREAVNTIISEISKNDKKDPVSTMEMAIDSANKKLLEKSRSDPMLEGMGTTLVMSTICGDTIYIANIGDSRLYVIGDEIRQITRDHSYVQEMVTLGKLDKDSARNHEKKNYLMRALGVEENTMADFFEIKSGNSERILMCTDGLTNMVEDDDIKSIVTGEADIREAAVRLIEAANKNGGMDNITAVLIEP
jgi:protein phosphatase